MSGRSYCFVHFNGRADDVFDKSTLDHSVSSVLLLTPCLSLSAQGQSTVAAFRVTWLDF